MHLILNNHHPAQINSTPIMILNTVLLLIPATLILPLINAHPQEEETSVTLNTVDSIEGFLSERSTKVTGSLARATSQLKNWEALHTRSVKLECNQTNQ